MKLLHKYIFKEPLIPFLMSLSVMALILLAQFLLKNMDKFLGKGLPATLLSELIFYNMAWVIALAVPMAILISTLMAFGRMSSDNEITAMRASGMTYSSMIGPALIFAVIISAFMIYFNNWILPNMNHKARNLIANITKTNPTIFFKAGQLHDELDGYIFYFESDGEDKNKFKKATIIQYDNQQILKKITSDYAELVEDYNDDVITIKLTDGQIVEVKNNTQPKPNNKIKLSNMPLYKNIQIIKFKKNIIRLDANDFSFERRDSKYRGDRELTFDAIKDKINYIEEGVQKDKITIKNQIAEINNVLLENIEENSVIENHLNSYNISKSSIISPDSAIIFINDLIKKLPNSIRVKNEDGKYQTVQRGKFRRELERSLRIINNEKESISKQTKSKNKYLVELHKKFSLSIAGIVFILVGAPLGIIAKRGKFSISIAISLIFFLIYWAFLIAGEDFADKGKINPALSMWLPNIILLLIGLLLNLKVISNKNMRFSNIFKWKKGPLKTDV